MTAKIVIIKIILNDCLVWMEPDSPLVRYFILDDGFNGSCDEGLMVEKIRRDEKVETSDSTGEKDNIFDVNIVEDTSFLMDVWICVECCEDVTNK